MRVRRQSLYASTVLSLASDPKSKGSAEVPMFSANMKILKAIPTPALGTASATEENSVQVMMEYPVPMRQKIGVINCEGDGGMKYIEMNETKKQNAEMSRKAGL